MKKIIVSTLVIFLVLLAGFFFRGKQDKPTDGFGSSATFTPTGIAQTAKSNLTAQSPAANAISNTDRNPNLTPEWISSEAHAMNRSFPNAKAADSARKKLVQLADSFSASDREFLVSEIANRELGDNKRALSLYLLTLSPSSTGENFKQIAMMNDPVFSSPLPAHSPEEWQARAVTAFATGALQEIYKRLPKDPTLVREMQEIAEGAPIPLVARTAKQMLAYANSSKRLPASAAKGKR